MSSKFIFGIDEVGRGPLAGPVVVGVFGTHNKKILKNFPLHKDSKKMTEREREFWFDFFTQEKLKKTVFFEVGFSPATLIDKKGIVYAIQHAMKKCITKLKKQNVLSYDSKILLDGALVAPSLFLNQKTIIKGDEKEKLIACASVVAKVSRDRFMKKSAKKFEGYGFEIHKGYGTKKHSEMLKLKGPSKLHRLSFLKKYNFSFNKVAQNPNTGYSSILW